MLKFYHNPVSGNSRRVWITLLEKAISFEEFFLNLDNDQYQPEFLETNPFHHIPVLVDDGFRVIESLAILDYLEAKYSQPSLMPSDPKAIAIVRMVQMVTVNELWFPTIQLTGSAIGAVQSEPKKLEKARQQVITVLNFFEGLLKNSPYFGSDRLTLADVTTGTMVPGLPSMGVSFDDYPHLRAWCDRLMERESWQITQPSAEMIEMFLPQAKALIRTRLI